MSGLYLVPTVEGSRFNVASCVILEYRGQYIYNRSTRIQGRREERGPGTYGWTAKNDDTAAIRSRYEVVWRLLLLLY